MITFVICYLLGILCAIFAIRFVNKRVAPHLQFDGYYIFFSWLIVLSIILYAGVTAFFKLVSKIKGLNKLVGKTEK